MSLYIFPFLISFLISIVITSVLVWLSRKFPRLAENRFSAHRFSGKKISRLGGIAVISAFALAIFLDPHLVISRPLWAILVGCGLILLTGVGDDFYKLGWKIQLFFQVTIAILIFIVGVRVECITSPLGGMLALNVGKYLLPSLFFVIGWVVLLMNATNWIDGIDGLSSGVTFLGALTIFFLSLEPEVNQPPVGIVTMALAGSLLGFLLFNFYPARILAGTSGAMFMGFVLASLSIFAGAKIATALLVMAVPVIDAFWVIGERLRSGTSIFQADKRHLHFKLGKLGWSPQKITLAYYLITALIAAVALNTRSLGKLITIILVCLIMVIFLFLIGRVKKRPNGEKHQEP